MELVDTDNSSSPDVDVVTGAGTPPTRATKRFTGVDTEVGLLTGDASTVRRGGVGGGTGNRTVGRVTVGDTTGGGSGVLTRLSRVEPPGDPDEPDDAADHCAYRVIDDEVVILPPSA